MELEDVQSNLNLIAVILTELSPNDFGGYRGFLFPPQTSCSRHWTLRYAVLQQPGSQSQQSEPRSSSAGRLCLMLAASVPAVSDASHAPISLFDFADPSRDTVNRTLSPGTPVLPSPYSCRHPHRDGRIYLEAQEFKEVLHLFNKKGFTVTCR